MSMTARSVESADRPVGEALAENQRVRGAISAIVEEVRSASGQITGPRPPIQGREVGFEEWMNRAAEVRGRGMYYRYLGSGVGAGPLVELEDGSVKYDMICGIGVNFFGHSDPGLIETALEGATSDVVMEGNLQMNADAIAFAEALVEQAGRSSELAHAFLCGSGAMANENALKICFQKNAPASRVIAFADCFMGRSTTMASIGDSAAARQGLPLTMPVDYMPFYDEARAQRMSAGDVSGMTRYIDMSVWHLEQYLNRHPGEHACFIFELVQGEGGFNVAPVEFHRALMDVCKTSGVAVWADEIQTFGRTTEMFAFEALGLGEHVDVCTVGKMSQVCAALYTREYNPKPGLLSGTFLGSSVGLRVGRKIIERLRDGGYYGAHGSIAAHHRLFQEGVRTLIERHPEWFPEAPGTTDLVGGFGGMMRFTPFGGEKEAVVRLCKTLFDEGVITFYCGHGPYHVRMLPPLGVMREEDWPPVFEILERAMGQVAA